MGVVIEPNLKTEIIEVPIHDEVTEIAEVGKSFPIIQINNVLIPQQQITKMRISIELYSLPTFAINIIDIGEKITKSLSNTEYDKITLFLGHKDIHIKFDGIITSVIGTNLLKISGIMGVNEMFDTEQKLFKDKTVTDIIKDFCEKTKFGLFTLDDKDLTTPLDVIINPNRRRLNFINWLLKKYTKCLYSFDTFGYLHIGSIKKLFQQPIDKYKFDVIFGYKLDKEREFIFSNDDNHEIPNDDKIRIQFDNYSIQTNFGHTLINTFKELEISNEKEIKQIESDNEIGMGKNSLNFWSGFSKHKNIDFDTEINKLLLGNFISIELNTPCYEIVPLSIIGLEIFQNIDNIPDKDLIDKQKALDKEHSGKHLVIGYSYFYDSNKPNDNVTQKIELI